MHKGFAKKSLGQNFLRDLDVIRGIIDEVAPQPGETIIEIGPGRGALTEPLVATGARIIAIELDDNLSIQIRERFAGAANCNVVNDDALEADLAQLITPAPTARVVANLPYNVSTAILQRLFQQPVITEMTLMLQREVVDRIMAGPGDPERGFLSVLVEAHSIAEPLFDVPPTAFKPVPKVWSSVVRLTTRNSIPPDLDEAKLMRLVGVGFQQRRKTILNNLKASPGHFADPTAIQSKLESAGIEPTRRAQTLTLDEWFVLTRTSS
ncbi:MAG: 16S rRNA (adenine(1518)-N(6)/adenine(1519)-N(6))-dimethyltransferase RsmA [Pyrinomonadaceae bacterium]